MKLTGMGISKAADHNAYSTRHDMSRAFARARRHSRHVKQLKIILPIAAVLILAGLTATTYLNNIVPENISIGSTSIEDSMIVMTNPGMSGRNKDGIKYSLKAERALLPAANPDDSNVYLENVVATVPVDGTVTAVVDAASTLYNRISEKLKIDDPFTIKLSNGMTANFQSADIDIKNGTLESSEPVSVDAPQASVVARNVKFIDNGKKIQFGGGVHVKLAPSALRQPAQ